MVSPTRWTWFWASSRSCGDGQGSLACCSLWDHKESDMTEQLNWIEPIPLYRNLIVREPKRRRSTLEWVPLVLKIFITYSTLTWILTIWSNKSPHRAVDGNLPGCAKHMGASCDLDSFSSTQKEQVGYQEGRMGSDQEPASCICSSLPHGLTLNYWIAKPINSMISDELHKQYPFMNCCFRIYPRQTLMSKPLGKRIQFLLNSILHFQNIVQWHGSRVSLWDSNRILPLRDELLTWGGGSEEFWPQRPPASLCSVS